MTDPEIVDRLGKAGWAFFGAFHRLQAVQRKAIPPIYTGKDTLVTSATASGKTEAILAPLVARLLDQQVSHADTIRLLVVAPTRALVNDLAARVDAPLTRLGLSCGRQTSDQRNKRRRPFTLITTPESFDSMLVRDGVTVNGQVVGHLLAGVRAVFIDEAHLFDGTARGDQLCWLLGRLRRLRAFAANAEADEDGRLQICAASATVSDPDALARRLLSQEAVAVQVAGTRDVEIFGPSDAADWRPLHASDTAATLTGVLEVTSSDDTLNTNVERRLWQALSSGTAGTMRKILVFVPTRRRCDILAAHLAATLPRRRDIQILAHHGSLDRGRRERAEQTFATARDAVLVATTTLEVGIDIGDVDLVALVGAPPGTRSLLQRIGRAGRRVGCTRLLALPRNGLELAAFASMLVSTRDGTLEPEQYARRWSVFVQQAASFVAQTGRRGRSRADFLDLAQAVWPESPRRTAEEILGGLIEGDCLEEQRDRLFLGEPWANPFDEGSRGMHANLDSTATGIPVVDSGTGEVIATVAEPPPTDKGIALGGQIWDACCVAGELLLTPRQPGRPLGGFRYAARGAPTGAEFAVHVRRGLGFEDVDAPVIRFGEGLLWLHFGGSAYEAALLNFLPALEPWSELTGIAVGGRPDIDHLHGLATRENSLPDAVEAIAESVQAILSPGPYHSLLPETCRRRVTMNLFGVQHFRTWLASRNVWEMPPDDRRLEAIRAALSAPA